MSKEIPHISSQKFEAKTDTASKLYFEPGDHDTNLDAGSRIDKGDLNIHAWNKEVGERMRSYGPRVIGIDGLSPHAFAIDSKKSDYEIGDKKWIWTVLPDNPRRLNSRGEVIVVSGDPQYMGMVPVFGSVLPQDKAKSVSDELSNYYQGQRDTYFANTTEFEIRAFTVMALEFAGLAALMLDDNNSTISRRNFLQSSASFLIGGGVVLAGGVLGDIALPRLEEFSNSHRKEEFLQGVLDIVRPRFFKDEWVDGRTALVIAKTGEALKIPGLVSPGSKGAVVMGGGHAEQAGILMEDKDARKDAIYKLAKTMTGVIGDINKRYGAFHRADAVNTFLDFMCRAEFATVQDSGLRQTSDPDSIIGSFIRYKGYNQSPEVMAAVKSLRL